MPKHIILISQARQGHHAVMEWLCQQTETGIYHNNLTINGHEVKNNNFQYNYGPEGLVKIHRKPKSINVKETPGDAELIIYNFINQIDNIKSIADTLNLNEYILSIVVRDLYNFVASLVKRSHKRIPGHIEHWKKMIRLALGSKNILDINFNRWFASYQYRVALTMRLGISRGSSALPKHSEIGKSSFGEKEHLGVLDRWKNYEDSKSYWELLDKEAIELNEKYFGFTLK